MSSLSLLSSVMFSFYLFAGLNIFFRNMSSNANRLFLFISFILSLWFLSAVYIYSTIDVAVARESIRIGSIGIILFAPSILHFALLLYNGKNLKYHYLLYIPFIIFAAINLKEPIFFSSIYMKDGYWHLIPNFGSIIHKVYSIFSVSSVIASIAVLFRWYKKTESRRNKRQALILGYTLLVWIVIITIEEIIIPALLSDYTLGLGPITFIIPFIGMAYVIIKYRFLESPLSFAEYDIIDKIEEIVIVLNNELKVIMMNRKAYETLGLSENIKNGMNFAEIIDDANSLVLPLKNILSGGKKIYNGMLKFVGKNDNQLVNTFFSTIIDDMNDPVGILVIGRETKKDELIEKYNISNREMEVILEILSGYTILEIAKHLSISELTVKSHVTHIYNKIGIDNRVQLLECLKQYHLVP